MHEKVSLSFSNELTKEVLFELGEAYLKEKGKIWLRAISPSMEPFIHVGDKVLAESVEPEDINIGDVIVFKRNESLFVTHRVIGKKNIQGQLHFLEKGDRDFISTWIDEKSVIARVILIKRKDNSTVRLNGKRARMIYKLFALCLSGMYIFENKIKTCKEKAKGYKVFNVLREQNPHNLCASVSIFYKFFNMFRVPYRYTYKILSRIENRMKRTFVSVFVKGMKFYG